MSVGSLSTVPAVLFDALTDPNTGKLYERAQMLINCGHSLSLPKAVDIFGQMQKNGRCKTPSPCPTCGKAITAYAPNLALQEVVSLVEKIQDVKSVSAEKKLEEPRATLPSATSQTIPKPAIAPSYYPSASYDSWVSTRCDNCGASEHKGKCHL